MVEQELLIEISITNGCTEFREKNTAIGLGAVSTGAPPLGVGNCRFSLPVRAQCVTLSLHLGPHLGVGEKSRQASYRFRARPDGQ